MYKASAAVVSVSLQLIEKDETTMKTIREDNAEREREKERERERAK